jgi:hypothetical protein
VPLPTFNIMKSLTVLLFCVTILHGCGVMGRAIASMESICPSCDAIDSKKKVYDGKK